MTITSIQTRRRLTIGMDLQGKGNDWLLGMLLGMALVVSALGTQSAQAQEPTLQAVDITNLPGSRVQLRFQMSQPVEEPRSFTINDPARIVLDFLNTKSSLSERQKIIGSGVAERVSVLEGEDRTRASISLSQLVPYSIRREGDSVLLTLEAGSLATATSTVSVSAAAPAPSPSFNAPALLPRTINNIDFRRGSQGEAVISMVLSDPATTVDVREEGNRIVADFIGARLPRDQERRLDVTDFATPVTLIDALNQGSNARIAIQPTGLYEYLAYQADDRYTIEIKPVKEEEEEDPKKKTYTGELLSLNFQDIEVRAVLQIIADFTGLNVVVSDTVQGNLTLRLQNVPWDQALDIILRTKGLTQRQNGNVIYIAPTEEVTAREKLELESSKQLSELEPLRSELIQVNYAKASDLSTLLKQTRRSGQEEEALSLLSARGTVTVDERTNTLLVQDTPNKLSEIRSLVTRLDVPVRQVMIDSRVVIANSDFSRGLGVRFGATGVRRNGDFGTISTTGTLSGTDTITQSAVDNLTESGQAFPVTVPSLNDRLGVNLPIGNAAGSLALAILGQDYLIDLELTALQVEGRGEVLSNPRVITTDRNEAAILQGREIPFVQISADGTPTTEFKEALLELRVTPQITPDNRIIMDLRVKKDEQGENVPTAGGGQEPTIIRREVETQVLVDNGETVVLGGIFEHVTRNSIDKVPFLGDIPAIGRLFRRDNTENDKLELLIFVTPQIVSGGIAVR